MEMGFRRLLKLTNGKSELLHGERFWLFRVSSSVSFGLFDRLADYLRVLKDHVQNPIPITSIEARKLRALTA